MMDWLLKMPREQSNLRLLSWAVAVFAQLYKGSIFKKYFLSEATDLGLIVFVYFQ